MLQFTIMSQPNRGLYLPTRLQRAVIDPQVLINYGLEHPELVAKEGVTVYKYKKLNVVKCPGIELRGLKASLAPRRQQTQASPNLEEFTFTPYFDDKSSSVMSSAARALRTCVDLVIENTPALKLKVTEVVSKADASVALDVHRIAMSQPMYQDDVTILTLKSETGKLEEVEKAGIKILGKDAVSKLIPEPGAHLVVVDDEKLAAAVEPSLKENGFVLIQVPVGKLTTMEHPTFSIVAHKISKDKEFVLLRKVGDVLCLIVYYSSNVFHANKNI